MHGMEGCAASVNAYEIERGHEQKPVYWIFTIAVVIPFFLHASIFYDTVFLVNIFFLQCVLCAILYAILLRSTGTTTQEIELVVEEESSSSKV